MQFHEIAGYVSPKHKTRLRRMKKYHPHIKISLIDGKSYYAVADKVKRIVPGWE